MPLSAHTICEQRLSKVRPPPNKNRRTMSATALGGAGCAMAHSHVVASGRGFFEKNYQYGPSHSSNPRGLKIWRNCSAPWKQSAITIPFSRKRQKSSRIWYSLQLRVETQARVCLYFIKMQQKVRCSTGLQRMQMNGRNSPGLHFLGLGVRYQEAAFLRSQQAQLLAVCLPPNL